MNKLISQRKEEASHHQAVSSVTSPKTHRSRARIKEEELQRHQASIIADDVEATLPHDETPQQEEPNIGSPTLRSSDRTQGINGSNAIEDDLRYSSVINREQFKRNIMYIQDYYKQRLDEIVYADRTIGNIVEDAIIAYHSFVAAVEAEDTKKAMEHLSFMRKEAAALLEHKGIKPYQSAIHRIKFEKTARDRAQGINGSNAIEDDLRDACVINRGESKMNIMYIQDYYKQRLDEIVYADRTIGNIVEEAKIAYHAFIATVAAGDTEKAMEHLSFMRKEAAALLEHKGIKSYQTAIHRIKFEKSARDRAQGINGSNATEDDLRDSIVLDIPRFKSNFKDVSRRYNQRLNEIVYANRTIGKICSDAFIVLHQFISAVESGDIKKAMKHLSFMRKEAAALLECKGIKSYQTAIDRIRFEKSTNGGDYVVNGRNATEDDLRYSSVINREQFKRNIIYIQNYYKQRLDEIVYADRTIGNIAEDATISFHTLIVAAEAGDTKKAMEHLSLMRKEAAALFERKGIKSYHTAINCIRILKSSKEEHASLNGFNISEDDLLYYIAVDAKRSVNNIYAIAKHHKQRLDEIVYADRTIRNIAEDASIAFYAFLAAVDLGDISKAMEHLTFMRKEAAALFERKGIKSYQTAIDRLKFERRA